MTWKTPDGNRQLGGAEAAVVRESLAFMVDQIGQSLDWSDDEQIWGTGVGLFDEITRTQQLVVTKSVAEHLLTETSDTLELTAIHEAVVGAIFRNLAVQIEIELDMEPAEKNIHWKFYWRRLTLAAYHECYSDEEDDRFEDDDPEDPWVTPQSIESRNLPQWESLAESLADRILWDRDFEMAENFLDTDPAKAAVLKQMVGVDTDYYSSVAADPKPHEVEELLRQVRRITHQKPR